MAVHGDDDGDDNGDDGDDDGDGGDDSILGRDLSFVNLSSLSFCIFSLFCDLSSSFIRDLPPWGSDLFYSPS